MPVKPATIADPVSAFAEAMAAPDPCPYCGEPVMQSDQWRTIAVFAEHAGPSHSRIHSECLIRSLIGSVGHQLGRCGCFGGTEEDPPGRTKREAALAAYELYRQRKGL